MKFNDVIALVSNHISDAIELDFGGVTHLSSPLIGATLAIALKSRAFGGKLVIKNFTESFMDNLCSMEMAFGLKYVPIHYRD